MTILVKSDRGLNNPYPVVIPFSDHYLCLDVKRLLVQLYGWKEGFKLNEMSDEMLKRKIDLCENYVSVYSKVEPCAYTKWRGRILEEMVGPVAMLTKRRYEAKQVSFDGYFLFSGTMAGCCCEWGLSQMAEARFSGF